MPTTPRVIVCLLTLLAITAPPAHALITIDFESLPAMTMINGNPVPSANRLSTQFLPTLGVSFSSASPYIAVVDLGVGHATSGSHGFGGVGPTGLLDYSSPVLASFFDPANPAIPAITDFVSLRGDHIPAGATVTLHAYDLSGAELTSTTLPDTGGTTWSVTAPNIHSVRWDGAPNPDSAGVALDDFSFNPVTPIPEPMLVAAPAIICPLLSRRRTR